MQAAGKKFRIFTPSCGGINRLLQPISNYLKGDRSIEFLPNTYSALLRQVIWEMQLKTLQTWYKKGALFGVGLPEKEGTSE